MKRLLIVAAVCMIAAPAFASPEILPVKGLMGTQAYDGVTGEQITVTRRGGSLWAATFWTGWFFSQRSADSVYLDWGDINSPVMVGGFDIGYATDAKSGTDAVVLFYEEENGWDNVYHGTGRVPIAGWIFDAGGSNTPGTFWGWITAVDISSNPMLFDGNDIDTDGLMDFGYTYWFGAVDPPGAKIGPIIAHDANAVPPLPDPGVDDAFDWFKDPNMGPNTDGNLFGYLGTYGFVNSYAQFYLELFAPQCPNQGPSGKYCRADIDGSYDCIVGLSDLAQLLSNYGMNTGAVPMDGDVDPDDPFFQGDGDVDLGDLAELLSQYGDDCTGP